MNGIFLSPKNNICKSVKKLKSKSARDKVGLFIAEGSRIVEDSVVSKRAEYIIVAESYRGEEYDLKTYIVPDKFFGELSDTTTPQGILSVCKKPEYKNEDIKGNTIIICDGISDPGNMGTIIRTAECSGADGIIVTKNATDPYSPKTVRSTMGSIFRMPVYFFDDEDFAKYLKDYETSALMLDGAIDLYETDFAEKTAFIIGNEAHGVSKELAQSADKRIKIPMYGNAESLNAAIAASVVMYEMCRRRRG